MQPTEPSPSPPGGVASARPSLRRRRGVVLGAAAALVVLAALALLVGNLLAGPPPGPQAAGPHTPAPPNPADLDRARLCLARAAEPGKAAEPMRSIRLRHSDRYGDILVVETAKWEWYCQFDLDGEYHGVFASGTVLFPPGYLPATDPGAPIKRLSTGSTQPAPGTVEFEDSGRISAAVAAVRIACPGVPSVAATVAGSMYYGRIRLPDGARKDACAAEALDAGGRVLGRAHW
jgi:hypothetical protein